MMNGNPMREPGERDAALRVIAVAPPEALRELRRDEDIELIRASDAIDALGELAHPLDDSSPERAAILLHPGAVSAGELSDYSVAAKQVDAGVRLVCVVEDPSAMPEGFDAAIRSGGTADEIRAALDVAEKTPEKTTETEAPTQTPTPIPEGPVSEHAVDHGETSIIGAIMTGADPLGPCLSALRERFGTGVRYLSSGANADEQDNIGDGEVAEVRHKGRVFGVLVAPNVVQSTLASAADWLAQWFALAEQQRQLRQAAFTDSLTGAWNRRYFDRYLSAAVDIARDRRADLSLMIFDIDNFKQYNDRFGHGAGDEILAETVRLLRSVIRPEDRVCRIGGDEFAVIFGQPEGPRTPDSRHPHSISDVACRFQAQICSHRFPKLGAEAPSTLTISGGLATFPWDGHSAESLVDRADELLLESKRQGKNSITLGPGAEKVCSIKRGSGKAPDNRPIDRD